MNNEKLMLKIHKLIERTVRNNKHSKILATQQGVDYEDLISEVFLIFMERKYHEKFNSEKSSFDTFVRNYTILILRGMIQAKVRKGSDCELQGRVEEYREDSTTKDDDITASQITHQTTTFIKEENKWNVKEGFMNDSSPEDLVACKELMNIIREIFIPEEIEVITEMRSRREEAERLGYCYNHYCDNLNKKVKKLNRQLRKLGYKPLRIKWSKKDWD